MANLFRTLLVGLAVAAVPSARGHGAGNLDRGFTFRFDAPAQGSYAAVFDVEGPNFEILSGNWTLSKDGAYHDYYFFTIAGPGTGDGRARWIAEGLPRGTYLIEFWANSGDYPADARYEVVSATGVSGLTVNMNYVPPGWRPLGTFDVDRSCVVNVSDYWTGAGTMLSVDALRFTLQSTAPPAPVTVVPPHIGVCIDDCGAVNPADPEQPIYGMLRLPFPMTFAVLPLRLYTNQTAEEIFARGSEVILHQPMAAISVPDPGAGGITDAMTPDQVRATVAANLDSLPHAVGMNNHMGSLITQQVDKMQVCMEELLARGLWFYDSRTYTLSVAYDMAKANGLLTGERDLFIDGNSKEEAKALVRSLAERALHAPHLPHLAIGHVRTHTADALSEIVPELAAMGVEVWPVSRCLAQVVEADAVPAGALFETVGNWVSDPEDRLSKQLYDGNAMHVADPAATRTDTATFTPNLPVGGNYDLYLTWVPDASNASQLRAAVHHSGGTSEVVVDQSFPIDEWWYLGRFPCAAGSMTHVILDDVACTVPGRLFRADAVTFVYAGPIVPVSEWLVH